MSGRIWVVELLKTCSLGDWWEPMAYEMTRAKARSMQKRMLNIMMTGKGTRVVQYVRQGGAR